MNLTEAEIKAFEDAKSIDDHNAACDAVKSARGGQYPPDWYEKMIATGKIGRLLGRFR